MHALQDTILEHFRQHKLPVTIFLANGIRLQGIVASVDTYSLLLIRNQESQLIYKSAISTIMPSERELKGQVPDPFATSQS